MTKHANNSDHLQMVDRPQTTTVENPINRYKIGSADKLKAGSDGSTAIYG
jgi:hypothetical protein